MPLVIKFNIIIYWYTFFNALLILVNTAYNNNELSAINLENHIIMYPQTLLIQ
jgi:hypothetical protein